MDIFYIASDDEVVGRSSSSDSELENETPQEKRLRLAKQYLSQVEAESEYNTRYQPSTLVCYQLPISDFLFHPWHSLLSFIFNHQSC